MAKNKVFKQIYYSVAIGVGFLLAGAILNHTLYEPTNIWGIALFHLDKDENILNYDYSSPFKEFSPQKKIRTRYHYCTGYADPFLFVDGDYLYLFYERELLGCKGTLCAFRTRDLETWEDLGTILSIPGVHLSYPNVFRVGDVIYMIPETKDTRTVSLYKATSFPFEWEFVDNLLNDDEFVDSCVIERDGKWILFTTAWKTTNAGLRIYISDSLDGEYIEHPDSPVSSDYSNMRCGGSILCHNGTLFRPAQFDKNYYGENLQLFIIKELSDTTYEESYVKDMISHSCEWSAKGGHHFNTAVFNGEIIVAMDGKKRDNFINNRTRKLFTFFADRK